MSARPVAVQFGAGNIGRGFIGQVLHEAGYEVVFADVSAELIGRIRDLGAYEVIEVDAEQRVAVIDGIRGIDSAAEPAALAREIAGAAVLTTAVGMGVLLRLAPAIVAGLAERPDALEPLVVMACENGIGATDALRAAIEQQWAAAGPARPLPAVFANTAVDRIVPAQTPIGLEVRVEPYREWVVETAGLGGRTLQLPGARFVEALGPSIERKLFTVNTGHAAVAYHGFLAGAGTIAEALALPQVAAAAEAALVETSALLVAKHGLDPEAQRGYRERILARFRNPALPDTVLRVGRDPLRKLGPADRFIGPAAQLAERAMPVDGLLAAVAAALRFRAADDPQAVALAERLAAESPAAVVSSVMGIEPDHPLHDRLLETVAAAR